MDEVKQFVSVLQGLGDFDPGHYSRRLQKASKSTRCLSFFQYQGPEVSQNGASFDNRDCLDLINLLAASSIARCLANVSEDYGFRGAVDQGQAVDLSKKKIASLLSSMYGDHVNNYLSSRGERNLQEFRNQPGFFENYHKLLLSSPFDHNALSQNVGRNYTLALLYCYEYFKHGPGFDMTEVLTAESEDMTHWIAVFKNWISQSQSDDFKKNNPDFRIEKLLVSVGGVLALNGYPDATARDAAQHLKDRVVGDVVKWEIADDIAQFHLGQNVWASWDSATYDYQSAVVQAVKDVKTEYLTIPTYSEVPVAPSTQVTRTFGEQVDQYMSEFWATSLFTKRAGNRIRTEYLNPFNSGGCFRPGTQVIVSSGTKNIEDLREGDIVLTKGGESSQWGVCSDEVVAQSVQSDGHLVPLYGFNGERPFTSASHVFYTTTGLRALDPADARKENPWLEVGKLRVGHQLIWTEDGSTYEPITIQSITTEQADCSHIYGVHLREGLRSYHANGYLVHLNYPEITAKSISDAIRSVDPKTQIALLAQFKELQPLFERFGGSTLADALTGQLKDSYTRKKFNKAD